MVRSTSEIIKGDKVYEALLKGSKEIADAVSTTFGPYGKNVALTMLYNLPHVTKDGVTVARNISLVDQAEDVACQIIKQAATKTADVAGDGTTSTVLLTYFLVKYSLEYLKANPNDTTSLKYELEKIGNRLIEKLDNITVNIDDYESMYKIARVASNGDHEISEMISTIFKEIGKDGVVSVQQSNSYETFVQTTNGIRLDRGYISPSLESRDSFKKTYMNPKVVITSQDITTTEEAVTIFRLQEYVKHPLLIICNDLTGSALNAIAYAKATQGIPIEVIRAPFIADARKEALKDLAIITGATIIDEHWEITSINETILGSAESFEISPKETFIIGRNGSQEEIESRIAYYEDKIKFDTEGLKDNYSKRLSMFTSGASVIFVGGTNEVEIQEKKDRLDDTIKAVKAALKEGVVIGGTICYHDLAKEIDMVSPALNIFKKAITALTNIFYSNGDIHDFSIVNNRIDFEKGGIIDPSLVIKSTILNSIGAAIMIFTTECIVIKTDPE